jgi:NADPH2:quinone reductase
MKGLKVIGCPMAISTHRDPSIRKERVARLLAWAESGALKPLVSASFPIAEVKEAMLAKWQSRHVGGIALHPQDL